MYYSEKISDSAKSSEKKKPKIKLGQLFIGMPKISIAKAKRPKNRKKP